MNLPLPYEPFLDFVGLSTTAVTLAGFFNSLTGGGGGAIGFLGADCFSGFSYFLGVTLATLVLLGSSAGQHLYGAYALLGGLVSLSFIPITKQPSPAAKPICRSEVRE